MTDTTPEQRQEAWGKIGTFITALFEKNKIAFEQFADTITDAGAKQAVKAVAKAAGRAAVAVNTLFTGYDEFVLEEVDRSPLWSGARTAIRLAVAGASAVSVAFVFTTIGALVFPAFAAAGIGFIGATIAGYYADNATKSLLDQLEGPLQVWFSGSESEISQAQNSGDARINVGSDAS
jgi:hypothetical protein